MTHYEKMLAHLVRMARHPAWINHARYRVKELEQTDLYAGIGKDVARCLRDQAPPVLKTRIP